MTQKIFTISINNLLHYSPPRRYTQDPIKSNNKFIYSAKVEFATNHRAIIYGRTRYERLIKQIRRPITDCKIAGEMSSITIEVDNNTSDYPIVFHKFLPHSQGAVMPHRRGAVMPHRRGADLPKIDKLFAAHHSPLQYYIQRYFKYDSCPTESNFKFIEALCNSAQQSEYCVPLHEFIIQSIANYSADSVHDAILAKTVNGCAKIYNRKVTWARSSLEFIQRAEKIAATAAKHGARGCASKIAIFDFEALYPANEAAIIRAMNEQLMCGMRDYDTIRERIGAEHFPAFAAMKTSGLHNHYHSYAESWPKFVEARIVEICK